MLCGLVSPFYKQKSQTLQAFRSGLCRLRPLRCADFVLLNKIDTLKEGQLDSLVDIAKSLNPLSKVSSIT